MEKCTGLLISWSGKYGLICNRSADGRMHKSYVHVSRIEFCEPELPYSGCVCKFNLSPRAITPGRLPFAIDCEIFHSNPDANPFGVKKYENNDGGNGGAN